jgi:hypothetical protein
MTRVYARVRACVRPTHKMLQLVRAFAGSPPSTVRCLRLPTESLLVSHLPLSHPSSRVQSSQLYPSADTVVILDATSLRLVRTLAFSQVFPSRDHANAHISSLVVDPTLKLVCNCSPITLRIPLIAALSLPRWLPHPVRGSPFGPSLESPPALGLFTHRSFFPMTRTSQLSTADPVGSPCYYVLVVIAHLVQVSWPSRHC